VTVEVARRMQASPASAWRVLSEPASWPSWGPTVRAVEADDEVLHTGSTGRVQTAVGVWVPFKVTEVDPGHRWTWRVAGIPATGHRVEPDPDGCRVVFEVPTWGLAYAAVCEVALRRIERLLRDAEA
jgi:uncharacterized protein YndB with AHSA1/START domain